MSDKEVYEKTLEMFNNSCALCGRSDVELHHIRFGNHLRHTFMGNVIPLCRTHHKAVHDHKWTYLPTLVQIVNDRMEQYGYNNTDSTNYEEELSSYYYGTRKADDSSK